MPVTLAPVGLGLLLLGRATGWGRRSHEALPVVTGVLSFFLLLDLLVGLAGRYDLSLAAVALGLGLWRLTRRPHTGQVPA